MKRLNLRKYYTLENCTRIFDAIESPQWKIWKVIDIDKQCYQNRKMISTPEKLMKFIHQCKNPQAVYVSVSSFLNPHRNHGFLQNQKKIDADGHYYYPRSGYTYADCLLLDTCFFVDIDSEKDLRLAQKDARKIIKRLMGKLQLKFINFSGTKGIHLMFGMKKNKIANPFERIRNYKKIKADLAKEVVSLKLKTIDNNHLEIMKDNFRVYAVPYSIKPNGNIVWPISLTDFMNKDIYSILSLSQPLLGRKVSEAKADDKKVAYAKVKPLASHKYGGRMRAGLSSYHNYFAFANFVPGLNNNYIPFIKIHKKRFDRIYLNKLSGDLSDILIFEEENYKWIISLKLFQKAKLLKIMRRLKAVNFNEFNKRYAKFRFTNILDKDGNEIETAPKLVDYIQSDKRYTYSRSHSKFFKEFVYDQSLLRGKAELKTYEVKAVV